MSKSNNNSNESNGDFFAKLRRLKIQESVLTSSVNKSLSTLQLDDENFQTTKEFKKYESSLRDNLIEIKNLLEDVKIATNARGNIEKIDIDEIKRDVLDLEEKLKSFKAFLQTEIQTLKLRENEITYELSNKQREKKQFKKTVTKSPPKQFNQIVPSPVRVLINSPFKCPEVQRFQEFVSNSKRYNGWNEYNHNVFIQIWNKYFISGNYEDVLDNKNTEQFYKFKAEVMEKISGLISDDIMSHSKWYLEYVNLKNKQQKALEMWKENKQKMRRPQAAKQVSRSNRSSESSNRTDKLSNQLTTCKVKAKDLRKHEYSESNFNPWSDKLRNEDQSDASRILKTTEQWRNKCQGQNDTNHLLFPITTNKRQLRIPSWRAGLQDI